MTKGRLLIQGSVSCGDLDSHNKLILTIPGFERKNLLMKNLELRIISVTKTE